MSKGRVYRVTDQTKATTHPIPVHPKRRFSKNIAG